MSKNDFDKKFKKWIIIVLIFVLIAVISPFIIYLINFCDNSLSKNPTYWGIFGDYIGGTVNTIISIGNLVLLVYVSYLVSKMTSDENQKLAELTKKREAYDDIAKLAIDTNAIWQRFEFVNSEIELLLRIEKNDITIIYEVVSKIKRAFLPYSEFYHCIKAFNVRYGYLFEYNFNSEVFNKLINSAEILRKDIFQFQKDISKLYFKTNNLPKYDDFLDFAKSFALFLTELNKEIDDRTPLSEYDK